MPTKPPIPRCRANIYVREQLRRTGRAKSGFERHYTQQQCSRRAIRDGYCKQHLTMKQGGYNLSDCSWREEFL